MIDPTNAFTPDPRVDELIKEVRSLRDSLHELGQGDPRVNGLIVQVGALSADLTATKFKLSQLEGALASGRQGGASQSFLDALKRLLREWLSS